MEGSGCEVSDATFWLGWLGYAETPDRDAREDSRCQDAKWLLLQRKLLALLARALPSRRRSESTQPQ